MTADFSRRDFIRTSICSTLGCSLGLPSLAIRSAYALAEGPKDPIRIKTIYLAKPVPSWPTPRLDVQAEMKKLDAILANLQKDLPDVVFEGGDLLRVIDDVPKVRESVASADGALLFNLTSTVGKLVEAVADMGKPTLLFSQPYSGHDWSLIADMQKAGKKIDVIASSHYPDLVAGLAPIRTVKRLSQSKILVLRKAEKDDTPETTRHGARIAPLQHAQLMEAYQSVPEALVSQETERWISGAKEVVEPTREEIARSTRFYFAMKKVMEEENAQALAINCLGLFGAKKLPAYPCLGFSRLNNEGLVGACEADVESAFTMLLFQNLTGKPGFISDPVVDTHTNTVIHAHCVAPTRMGGANAPEEPYILRSHMEDDKGAAVQVTMKVGQTITMAKLVGSEIMLLSTGKIVDTPVSERGCRTKIATEVADARKLLSGYSHGLHRVIFYGDHTQKVERLGKYLGFQVTYET